MPDPITVSAILGIGGKLLDKFFPDPAERAVAEQKLIQMQQEGQFKEIELELQDRSSARERDARIKEAGYSNWRADLLALLAIFALGGLAWLLVFNQIPEGAGRDLLMMLSGVLAAVVRDVYSFEFGSSRGSKEKDIFVSGRRGK